MRTKALGFAFMWLSMMLSPRVVAWAQGDIEYEEIEALKQKVRELEAQNRAILPELVALRAELANRSTAVAGNRVSGGGGGPAASPDAPASVARPALRSASGQAQDETVRWSELTTGGSRLQFYGLLRLDLITDSARPDFFQTPFFIRSEDLHLGPENRQRDFTLHPRLTRVGMNFSGPQGQGPAGVRLSGKFEVDFQHGGRESRPLFRTRQAYLRMDWGDVFPLAGQTWDIVSPLYPTANNDTVMWNAGKLGDRRAQVRFGYEPRLGAGTFSFVGGIGLTGVSRQDLDGDGVRDGEASGKPNLQSRIGYAQTLWSQDSKLSLGVSGHYGWEETVTPFAGRDDFRSQYSELRLRSGGT